MNLGAKPSLDIYFSTQYAEAAVQDFFLKISLVLIPTLMFIKPNIKPTLNFMFLGFLGNIKSHRQGKGSLILRNP